MTAKFIYYTQVSFHDYFWTRSGDPIEDKSKSVEEWFGAGRQ